MSAEQIVKNRSFAPLLDRCAGFDALKHDTVTATSKMSFAEDGNLVLPSSFGSMSLSLEDNALCQLGERLGKHFWQTSKRVIPTDFYRQLHTAFPSHFAGLTNELLSKMDGKLLVRGYDQGVRAILSDQYVTLDNAEILDMASKVLGNVPFEIVESGKYYARNDGVQRDEMSIRVVVKNIKPSNEPGGYGLGVMIRNGETGSGASVVRPLVMRTSCMNSLVFKQGDDGERLGIHLTHKGSKAAKVTLMAAAIAEALPLAQEGLERFLETKTVEIDLASVIANLGLEQGWSEELTVAVGVGSEGYQSVFGLVNGITYAAHEVELSSYERVDMEMLASKFVYQPALATKLQA